MGKSDLEPHPACVPRQPMVGVFLAAKTTPTVFKKWSQAPLGLCTTSI